MHIRAKIKQITFVTEDDNKIKMDLVEDAPYYIDFNLQEEIKPGSDDLFAKCDFCRHNNRPVYDYPCYFCLRNNREANEDYFDKIGNSNNENNK